MGSKLKQMGLKIDTIMCSAHRRALISARLLREGFSSEESGSVVPIHLYVKGFEHKGVYRGDQTFPGLTKQEALVEVPDL